MKSIGGYFELELPVNKEYHRTALRLNSGRTALQYLLLAKKVNHIYVPLYICDSVVDAVKKLDIGVSFYKIDSNFFPELIENIKSSDYILYVNYFGVCEKNIQPLCQKYRNLIIDNSQGFYMKPLQTHDCFYSPRKFFGVPDGGYLYTNNIIESKLENDKSISKFRFLLERIENSAEKGYWYYLKNENGFDNTSIKNMSKLTLRILQSIDYAKIRKVRNENYSYLHNFLGKFNNLKLSDNNLNAPLCYPFLSSNQQLKEYLIVNKIYVPTYWREVTSRVEKNSFEWKLTNFLIPLPIDQRYNTQDMHHIVHIIKEYEE